MTWAYYDGPHPGDIAYEQCSAETANRIIAIVREALLSEEVQTALLVHGPHIPSALGRQMYGKDAEMILKQVLDAAFGPASDGEQHGEGEGDE